MIIPVQYVHVGLGVAITFGSIPLILRKVPMNPAYGIRIKKSFASAENWYAINAYGGKLFAVFGIVLLAFSFFTWHSAPSPTSLYAPVYLAIPLLVMVPVIVLIQSYAKRLPG